MTLRVHKVGASSNSGSFSSMQSTVFHHNSSSSQQQRGSLQMHHGYRSLAGSTNLPAAAPSIASISANPSCPGLPLTALVDDNMFIHNKNDNNNMEGIGGDQQQEQHQASILSQQQSSLAATATSESLADALRGFQETIALMSSQSQPHSQSASGRPHTNGGLPFNQRPIGMDASAAAVVKPCLGGIGNSGPSLFLQSQPQSQAHLTVPKPVAQPSMTVPPAASPSSSPNEKAEQKAAGKKTKKKGGWRKPSDKPKRPLSAYNIFFQHEREKIVSAAESPKGEETIPSIATETRGVPVAALTKAVYTGVNDQLQSQQGSSSPPPFSAVRHQRALTATSSPTAVQTIRTLQKIILRSRGQTKGTADKAKLSRSHTKTHGKISFVDLAKTVARKWKELDPASKAVYNAFADMERNLYKEKVKAWERKKKAEADSSDSEVSVADGKAAVVETAKESAAQPTANKKPDLADEDADRIRRILENASRHGSIHNNTSASSSDDETLGDDVDLFADFAIPQDLTRRPVPAAAPDRRAGTSLSVAELGTGPEPGPSVNQIASYVNGMQHQDQTGDTTALMSRLDRIVRKGGPPKARKPQVAPGSSSLDSMFDGMFGADIDIQAQEKSISELKDAIVKTTAQCRSNHPGEPGDDDMLFDFASDYTTPAAPAELNILGPSIQTGRRHVEPASYVDYSASSAAAMNNPLFDPLHLHAEDLSRAIGNGAATQEAADHHGLNEFLRWAFESGTD